MEPLRPGDPRQVGPYRLRGRLGGGGMGQVFLGRSRGGRPVAVKVVRPELADDAEFRRRFTVEVEAAQKVGGFYTAQVVDADPGADPPWLVTAYIPGPSLHQAVAEHGPLPPAAVRVLGAGLAEGLATVHNCGLVHRDLKPGNVILAADGPRVIDFGIVRALDATSHTASGAVVGTPAFMSPEQVRGEEVGRASDVFSLGSVLVFAATGRGPFGTGQSHAVMFRITQGQPDLTGLPPELFGLVAACLDVYPGNRPGLDDLIDRLADGAADATRWLPPTVTTMITRLEDDLSEPSGDGSGSGTVAKYHPAIATALRIAGFISDPEAREQMLINVHYVLYEADPEHPEQYPQDVLPPATRAALMVGVARELLADGSDAGRARQLIEQAGRLCDSLQADDLELLDPDILEELIDGLCQVDPRRAMVLLDRAERLVPGFDHPEARARTLIAEAGRVNGTDPERATEIMGGAVAVARTIAPDPDYAPSLPRTLAQLGVAGHDTDRHHAERLFDLAEAAALDTEDRDWTLKWTAVEVAVADPARAERIIEAISEAYIRSSAWGAVLSAAASAGRDGRSLLDAAERSIAQPAAPEPAAPEPEQPGPWWGRIFTGSHQPGPEPEPESETGPFYLMYLAEGAARCDPARAEAIAARIDDLEHRSEAFARMAGKIAETDPLRARWWFDTAYQIATTIPRANAATAMRRVTVRAAAVAPGAAQQAARWIADRAERKLVATDDLVDSARSIASVDPGLAVRLIDLAEIRLARQAAGRRRNDHLEGVAKALMKVAAVWKGSDPEPAGRMLRRVVEVLIALEGPQGMDPETFQTTVLKTAVAPGVIEPLLREYRGPGREYLLAIAAVSFAATDARRAERLAGEITETGLRDSALSFVAELIAEAAVAPARRPR